MSLDCSANSPNKLISLWRRALGDVSAEHLFNKYWIKLPKSERIDSAWLFWGKAATPFLLAARKQLAGADISLAPHATPMLAIAPRSALADPSLPVELRTLVAAAEHPLPGAGSFAAGSRLLDFFAHIGRRTAVRGARPVGGARPIRHLHVLLSGGASSLAWVRPSARATASFTARLESLYRQPLSIFALNRERAKLCALKAGGAARWLTRLAPEVRADVALVSDVFPFGADVVGSGPFFDPGAGKIPHAILADNPQWLAAWQQHAHALEIPVRYARAWPSRSWQVWVREIAIQVRQRRAPGLMLFGGEPSVRLSRRLGANVRGGRMSQVAAGLALALGDEFARGDLEILCASSDGVDGRSGGAGCWLNRANVPSSAPRERGELRQALASLDTGTYWASRAALLPERATATNVQDVVAVWRKSESRPRVSGP